MRERILAALVALGICVPTLGSAALDGRPDAVVDLFFEDGSLASRETYRDGSKVGVHWAFWPDGTVRRRAPYGFDAFDGMVRTWDASGRTRDIRRYAAGREAGLQQSFGSNGELFLNYEARNGRRYGLLNSTPCIDAGHPKGQSEEGM